MDEPNGLQTSAVEIRMAATPVWIPVARRLAEGLAGRAHFDQETTYDVRLAVDEACAAVADQSPDTTPMTCSFAIQPGRMDIEVSGPAAERPLPVAPLRWRLLRAVTDELTLRHRPGHRFSIRMAKTMHGGPRTRFHMGPPGYPSSAAS